MTEKKLPEGFLEDIRALKPTFPLIILDFETNGLSPRMHQPIQASAMKIKYTPELFEDGKVAIEESIIVEHFAEWISCPNVPQFNLDLIGITQEFLDQNGKPLLEVMDRFLSFCGIWKVAQILPVWYIGHNALKFDREFLHNYMDRLGRTYPLNHKWWDTAGHYKATALKMIKDPEHTYEQYHITALNRRVKDLKFKLTMICEQEGISTDNAHTADADVLMTAWIFMRQGLAMKPVKKECEQVPGIEQVTTKCDEPIK